MDEIAKRVRSNILDISYQSNHGHIPTCFSIVEALLATYRTIRYSAQDPDAYDRDIFILSKGHGALAHYCVLSEFGYFDIESVRTFGTYGAQFGCHGNRTKIPGVEVSTGSLGHGIGVGVGMALANKTSGIDGRVVALVGDGEANEGTVWEAVMVAVDQKLDNLTIIYDDNGSQGRCLSLPNASDRFKAFGCHVQEVPGHDVDALSSALAKKADNVSVIVADTQKGYGCQTLIDNMYEWHRKSPDEETLIKLKEELDAWHL